MNSLVPVKYANSKNSTVFEDVDFVINVSYSVQARKKFGVLPDGARAIVEVDIGSVISCSYDIPRGFKVGK